LARIPPRHLAVPLLAAVLTVLVGCRGEPSDGARRRLAGAAAGWNVLLLSVDTLRADRLGAYGYERRPTSPRLDQLVAGGVRFESAMAPRAATWPSLASVLTGLYPSGHGVLANGYGLPDDLPSLPRLLHDAGYTTAAFLSNMCKANHESHKWDERRCAAGADGRVNRWVKEWSGRVARDRPFLLWVHYMGAHPPYYNGGDRAATVLDPGYDGPLQPRRRLLDRVMQEPIALGPRDLVHLDAIYDAAVAGTDGLAGALLAELQRAGLLERTVVVFLADHGEELYQHHRYLYHACSVYQTTLHVPLAFVAPGLLPAGASVAPTVELLDVLPTVLELLGLPLPAERHGASLVGYLERPAAAGAGKPAFSEYDDTRIHTALLGDWKLVDNPDGVAPRCMEGVPEGFYPIARQELYDLGRDPGETTNLAASQPARVAALRELIARRFAGLANRARRQELDPELRKELQALGYVAD
jgi:arylsulfatase A-like enzyme